MREIADHFSAGLTTIWNALHHLGERYKKRKIYRESDPTKRKKFIEFVKNQNKNKHVFADESGIDRYLHREYCRAPKGEQVYEAVPGRKFERGEN